MGSRGDADADPASRGFVFAREGDAGSAQYFEVAPDGAFVPVTRSELGPIRYIRFVVGSLTEEHESDEPHPRRGAVLARCSRCLRPLGRLSAMTDGGRYRVAEMPTLEAQDRDRVLVGFIPTEPRVPAWIRQASRAPDTRGPVAGAQGWWATQGRRGPHLNWHCRCGPRRFSAESLVRAAFNHEAQIDSGELWGVLDV